MTFLTVLLAACGSDSTPSKEEPAGPIALTELRHEVAKSLCETMAQCPSQRGTDTSLYRLLAADLEACVAYWGAEREPHEDLLVNLPAAIASGQVTYDGTIMRACLDASVESCDLQSVLGCVRIAARGTTDFGEACSVSDQCAGLTFCDFSQHNGSCAASIPAGGACDVEEACSQVAGPAYCIRNTCVHLVTFEASPGETCDWYAQLEGDASPKPVCPAGSYCKHDLEGNSACAPYVAAETPCASPDDCGPDSACVVAAGSESGKCQKLVIVDDVGEPCDAARRCNPYHYLGCVDGACASIGDGTSGTRCDASDGPAFPPSCTVGFTCDFETATCAPAE